MTVSNPSFLRIISFVTVQGVQHVMFVLTVIALLIPNVLCITAHQKGSAVLCYIVSSNVFLFLS
jgi:hypothetical protein